MDTQRIASDDVQLAVTMLKEGKALAFPTDTVYGLGCIYDDRNAIARVKAAKGRDENKPLPMMCADKKMIEEVACVNDTARRIITELMPGALTIVLRKKDIIDDYVTNGKETIAIRIPDHELVLGLLRGVGKPMLVTSANLSDHPAGLNDREVLEQLDGRIDGIVMGSSDAEKASTIVLVDDSGYKILRQGKITDEQIRRVLEGEKMRDLEVFEAIRKEEERQKHNVELIASENFVSKQVLEAMGSVLTNKYAEGYPGKRYYGGCVNVDVIEDLARERLCKIFGAEHANVQPHSGSQANMGVYMSVLKKGDRVLGMDLSCGGHLTHGHPLSFSGIDYDFYAYGVDRETEMIDYDEVLRIARECKPKMIVAGASAYPREIDFSKFREIADEVGAMLMVDMAHIAGLVAAGEHMNPVPYADFVTSTTHKTLRGPRGGVILCKEKYAKDLDRAVFPGIQGGPLEHIIAAKAISFFEVMQPEFNDYAKKVISNCKVLGETLKEAGLRLVTGGTDNHLLLVDVSVLGITGKTAEKVLDEIHITANKNTIPYDKEKPFITSGIRLGTAAMTTVGFGEAEFAEVGRIIAEALKNTENEDKLQELKQRVLAITDKFDFYA